MRRGERLWWAWTLLLIGAAAGLLWGGARWLDSAGLGSASFGRADAGCDTSLIGGLTLLAAAGLALACAVATLDRRAPGSVYTWDWARLAFALPVPAAGLALTAPGMLGCESAERIERLGRAWEALLGTPGAALGAACALALGAALGAGLRVDRAWAAAAVPVGDPSGDGWDDPAEIVDRAIAESEEFAQSDDAGRFRGVDRPRARAPPLGCAACRRPASSRRW